jgi:Dyp-type peroxidase family
VPVPTFDPDSDVVTGPVVPGAPVEPLLTVDEIQGNILPGFNTLHQTLLGLKLPPDDVQAARPLLRDLVPLVSTLAQVSEFRNVRRRALRRGEPRPPSPIWMNLALDVNGLQRLGFAIDPIRDRSFKLGMVRRSGTLGDPRLADDEGHPGRWVVGGTPDTTPDVLVTLAGDDLDALKRRASEVRGAAVDAGLGVVYEQTGSVLPDDREHFGFRDGISQAGARGRLSVEDRHFLTRRYIDPADARARRFSRPGQPLVWPGQFVFGYGKQRDDDPETEGARARGGADWMDNGSFLVFRRLRQDVGAFRSFLAAEVQRIRAVPGFADMSADRLGALLVGRWPKGTALMRSPGGDEPDPMGDRFAVNHFGFADAAAPIDVSSDPFAQIEEGLVAASELRTVDGAPADPAGTICPRVAHIRKVNPRDLPTDQGGADRTLTFQVLRRGIAWGPQYPATSAQQDADDGQRGLLFVSYQTSVGEQFETLNSAWMNRAAGPEGDAGHDFVVGQGTSPTRERTGLLRTDGSRHAIATLERWVIPTGGGFFFAPSLSVLRRISELEP